MYHICRLIQEEKYNLSPENPFLPRAARKIKKLPFCKALYVNHEQHCCITNAGKPFFLPPIPRSPPCPAAARGAR
ncbi:MAG: hypothetical protein Q4F30_07780 [Akkermansia sp.]|nr:hypothetical protein [Akkermansia sp.]